MSFPAVLGLLLAALAIAFVLYPLARPGRPQPGEEPRDELALRRAAIYREVLDLEFDRKLGKLSEADYRTSSAALLQRAAALLEQAAVAEQELDARLEQEIAAARVAVDRRRRDGATERGGDGSSRTAGRA
ncbi:MAG: hypothetical protein HY690_04985 [Chloroflexi bacterium]|nr:hypothetical protein [Chloroflexota bacterium]